MKDIFPSDLINNLQIQNIAQKWLGSMGSQAAEGFLLLLLKLMDLVFMLNIWNFRENIEGFRGRYVFRSKDDSIVASASFKNGNMKVYDKIIDKPDITITFRDDKALMNYLLSPKPDILGSILRQDVTINGNLNYLYKFAYMAKRLQLLATGQI
ncbi:MAG: hypothetical protein ABRQ31_06010 [Smithellaceae bacterium]